MLSQKVIQELNGVCKCRGFREQTWVRHDHCGCGLKQQHSHCLHCMKIKSN